MTAGIEAMSKAFTGQVTELKTELATVKASIDNTPDRQQQRRAPATGPNGNFAATDC